MTDALPPDRLTDEEIAVVIAALLAGRIDGAQAIASLVAIHDRIVAARVAAARAEERERIAQAIEACGLGADFGRNYDGTESREATLGHAYDEGLEHAARLARAGGEA